MPDKALVTPIVLKWARESARLSLDTISEKLKITVEKLSSWEDGTDQPTVKQAEKLAKLYRRPLAVFFLPDRPKDFDTLRDFRRKDHRREYSTALTFMIREIQSKQAWLSERLKEEGEPALHFIGRFSAGDGAEVIARDIRETLNLVDDPGQTDRLKVWTERSEKAGIFVSLAGNIHTRLLLDPEEVRGFAISDSHAPFVFINTQDYHNAQLFTLAHELAHLWLGSTGVFDLPSIEFRSALEQNYDPVEVLCNEVAAELLMPRARVSSEISAKADFVIVQKLARTFQVSSLAMAIRILNLGYLSRSRFNEIKRNIDEEYHRFLETEKPGKSGYPSPYVLTIRRNSKAFSHYVYDSFKGGRLSGVEASLLLGVKLNNFPKFEAKLLR